MIVDFIFLMVFISGVYSVYVICKRLCECVPVNRQMTLPQQIQPVQTSIPQPETVNNSSPLLPPIIIRCDIFENIHKGKNSSFESCAICIEKYKNDSRVAILENCNHMFHDTCITEWFKKSYNCPMCNA
jgi:hypothetical protein